MAAPVLMFGSETWALTRLGKHRIQSSEMRFLQKVKVCTPRNRIRNEGIRAELNFYSMIERTEAGKEKCIERLDRIAVD